MEWRWNRDGEWSEWTEPTDMHSTDWPELPAEGRYADPDKDENWVADPCTFCGGESFSAVCPGDGRPHRHGAIHLPDGFTVDGKRVTGFGYLCRSPECKARAEQAWREFWDRKHIG